jgi:hypothetical protein
MRGDIDEWLKYRQWDSADINSKLTSKSNIDFEVVLEVGAFGDVTWSGSFNRTTMRCTQETIKIGQNQALRVEDGECRIDKVMRIPEGSVKIVISPLKFPIVFEYQGSILSQLKDKQTNPTLQLFKKNILGIQSFDLLSPELLRSKTMLSDGKLGLGGEKLSSFVHESGSEGKVELQQQLSKIYSQLEGIETRTTVSGLTELEIIERFGDQKLKSPARHINDGMLRLMAILSQIKSGSPFLLFDEIENGINPELIEFLIDQLVNAPAQVLVTTHSPMILNYLEDEVAKQGVIYLYKNSQGMTRSVKLFDIPSMAKKLQFMGPGEAFVDTDLTRLYQEVETLKA